MRLVFLTQKKTSDYNQTKPSFCCNVYGPLLYNRITGWPEKRQFENRKNGAFVQFEFFCYYYFYDCMSIKY